MTLRKISFPQCHLFKKHRYSFLRSLKQCATATQCVRRIWLFDVNTESPSELANTVMVLVIMSCGGTVRILRKKDIANTELSRATDNRNRAEVMLRRFIVTVAFVLEHNLCRDSQRLLFDHVHAQIRFHVHELLEQDYSRA